MKELINIIKTFTRRYFLPRRINWKEFDVSFVTAESDFFCEKEFRRVVKGIMKAARSRERHTNIHEELDPYVIKRLRDKGLTVIKNSKNTISTVRYTIKWP